MRQQERDKNKDEDNAEVIVLVTQKKLDLDKQYNYSYVANLADELGWKVTRLQKAIVRVTKLLKAEEQEKEEKNDPIKDKEKQEG